MRVIWTQMQHKQCSRVKKTTNKPLLEQSACDIAGVERDLNEELAWTNKGQENRVAEAEDVVKDEAGWVTGELMVEAEG